MYWFLQPKPRILGAWILWDVFKSRVWGSEESRSGSEIVRLKGRAREKQVMLARSESNIPWNADAPKEEYRFLCRQSDSAQEMRSANVQML